MTAPFLPAVVHQVMDLPADRLAAVIGTWPEPAILCSGPGFGEAGRWSIYAAYPRLVLEATDRRWRIVDDSGALHAGDGDPLCELARLARRFDLAGSADAADPDACPFQGGMIGFLGYDLAPLLERLPRRMPRDSRLPDLRFALYDTAVTVDNRTGEAVLHAWDLTGEGREAAERRGRFWRRAIRTSLRSPRPIRSSRLGPLASNLDQAGYLERVRRAIEYIAAGDAFQINLSQRFTAHGTVEPLDLFLRLGRRQPRAVLGFPELGRPGRRLGKSGVVLPDRGDHGGDPADQGYTSARPDAAGETVVWPPNSRVRPRTAPS